MKKSNKNVVRKRPGRPATGQDPVTAIRLSAELRAAVDTWAEKQEDGPSRSEAIRRLVENALMQQALVPTGKPHKGAAKAKEMAKTYLNKRLADLPEAERLIRKGRLMKQPKGHE